MPSQTPPSDAPPTYEQSLHHPRLATGYTMPPQYTEFEDPFQHPQSGYPSYYPPAPRHHHSRGGSRRSVPYDTFAFVPQSNLQSSGGRSRTAVAGGGGGEPIVVLDDGLSTCSSQDGGESCIKMTLIPMRRGMAVLCLLCNIIIPGLGTILSGLCVFCCLRPNNLHWGEGKKLAACALNIGIGLAQLVLVPFLLLGWIWSILWGFAFLGMAVDDGMDKQDDEGADGAGDGRCRRQVPVPDLPCSVASSSTDMQSAVSIQSGRHTAYRTLQVEPQVHAPPPTGATNPRDPARRHPRAAHAAVTVHDQAMVVESATDWNPVTETEAPSGTSSSEEEEDGEGSGAEEEEEGEGSVEGESAEGDSQAGDEVSPTRFRPHPNQRPYPQYAVSAISEEPIMICESGSDWDCEDDDNEISPSDASNTPDPDPNNAPDADPDPGTLGMRQNDPHDPENIAPESRITDGRITSAGSHSSSRIHTVSFGALTDTTTIADISM